MALKEGHKKQLYIPAILSEIMPILRPENRLAQPSNTTVASSLN